MERMCMLLTVAVGCLLLDCTAALAESATPASTPAQAAEPAGTAGTSLGQGDADWPALLSPGTRVRVYSAGDDHALEGVFLAVDETSLRVRDGRDVVTVKRHAIRRLDMAMPGGEGKRLAIGSLIGAGFGSAAGAGAVFFLAGGISGDPNYNAAPPILVGLAAGTAVGGLIAHATRRSTWTELPIKGVRVSVLPTRRRGIDVALAIGF